MTTLSRGAAFVDRAGTIVAVDQGFATELGLDRDPDDPTRALSARAESSPELRGLLSGTGPDVARIPGPRGPIEIERLQASAGALLVARAPESQEWLEQAMRSQGLTRVAAGLAHDIKNPLNAMALQLALLTDKLSGEAGAASAGHLGALREQIGRVNEVVRRFLDVVDPSAPLGFTDLGALLADTATLFGHDARRHRIEIVLEAGRGSVRTPCDPVRVARVVLGIFSRALAETPEGGRLSARAETDGASAIVRVEHAVGDPDPETGYYDKTATAAALDLGGTLEIARDAGVERLTLRLPRNEAT
jgi:signal transduction histidine kinase